jgi:hypothetical protein
LLRNKMVGPVPRAAPKVVVVSAARPSSLHKMAAGGLPMPRAPTFVAARGAAYKTASDNR